MSDGHDFFDAVSTAREKRRTRLSPLEAGRGVLAIHRNGRRLFADGVALLERGRCPSAVLLAILGHEEFGKASAMGGFSVVGEGKDLRKLWTGMFESHSQKNFRSMAVGMVTGQLRAKVQESSLSPVAIAVADFVRIRERSTYVDCIQGQEMWSLPERVVERPDALELFANLFAAMRKFQMPSQVVGHFGTVWRNALSARGAADEKDRAELERARLAVDWSNGSEALQLDAVDRSEGAAWNVAIRSKLNAPGGA